MAAASTAALVCDTGALLDYLVESAPDHRVFRSAIDRARARYVPGLVLAEVDYFLRNERRAMQVFMQDLGDSDHNQHAASPPQRTVVTWSLEVAEGR